jgi:hypothetical protein
MGERPPRPILGMTKKTSPWHGLATATFFLFFGDFAGHKPFDDKRMLAVWREHESDYIARSVYS